jgi:hypothetical protein
MAKMSEPGVLCQASSDDTVAAGTCARAGWGMRCQVGLSVCHQSFANSRILRPRHVHNTTTACGHHLRSRLAAADLLPAAGCGHFSSLCSFKKQPAPRRSRQDLARPVLFVICARVTTCFAGSTQARQQHTRTCCWGRAPGAAKTPKHPPLKPCECQQRPAQRSGP